MLYGVRTCINPLIQTMDFRTIRKFWSGEIVIRENKLGSQIFDMVPPAYCTAEDSKEFAEGLVNFIRDEFKYQAHVIEIELN